MNKQYKIKFEDGKVVGPLTVKQIGILYIYGRLEGNEQYKRVGDNKWSIITEHTELLTFIDLIINGDIREDSILSEQYVRAIAEIEAETKPPINLVPKPKDINFLQDYVDENIQAASDEISNNLRQEIQRGIMNNETAKELSTRVRKLFKAKAYQIRLKTILRTETLRANNMGTLEGAHQAAGTGLKLTKWLDTMQDSVTSKICIAEHKKYGTPEQAIPLDQPFIVKSDNKTIKAQIPPFHCNCRSVLRIRIIE